MKKLKRYVTVLAALSVLFGATGCTDESESYTNSKINTVTEQITAINDTLDELQTVDRTLDSYIDNLETAVTVLETSNTATAEEISAIKSAVQALQQKDISLESKIEDLKTLTATFTTKDWTNATFATLTQYAAIQTELAEIKTFLNGLTGNVTATELSNAITASETEMKTWVNANLANGYYDIATVDAKLAAIEEKITIYDDTALKTDLAAQKDALEKAKNDLTTAYENAISTAISKHSGAITEVIEAYVQNAKNDLQTQIDAAKRYLAAIDFRLTDLEVEVRDLSQSVASLQALVDYLMEENERLYSQINYCLKGIHQIDPESKITYAWADDYSTCTATGICMYCEETITETTTAYSDGKYIATFENEHFKTQEIDKATTIMPD